MPAYKVKMLAYTNTKEKKMLFLYNATIVSVASMDKFTRGMALAKSLKNQRQALKLAHKAIKAGAVSCANHYLALWKMERKAYKLALSWQSI